MTFTTQSESVYQVDGKRIRQVKGSSTRHGAEWFEFSKLDVHPGQQALIYCAECADDPAEVAHIIVTSPVISVTPCLN